MSYFENYVKKLKELEKCGATVFCIGYSHLGRPIFCVKIGNGNKKIFIQSAIHAREHITCDLTIMLLKDMLSSPPNGSLFVVPLSNPDGVCLAKNGLKSVDDSKKDVLMCKNIMPFCDCQKSKPQLVLNSIKKILLIMNKNSTDFSLWKANIRGVDLNVNFDAKWGKGKQNVFTPGSQNYVGRFPNSESETKALSSFVRVLRPHMTISYHSKGEVIFYDFHQKGKQRKRDKTLAKEIAKITGYAIKNSQNSAGGFKDFCIEKLKIPSLTIEVGKETLSHPISKKHLLHIYSQNKKVIEKSLALLDEHKL